MALEEDFVKLGQESFGELYAYFIPGDGQRVAAGMNLNPNTLLDKLQVAVVLAKEKLIGRRVIEMNSGRRRVSNHVFQIFFLQGLRP